MRVADLSALGGNDLVLLRHGETEYNLERRVNGDPAVDVRLSAHGREQTAALAPAFAGITWRSAWCTRFPRTRATLALLLPPGAPEPRVLADLDDIDVGELEGHTIEEWRAWRKGRALSDVPPGGESRIHVLERYARGFATLAETTGVPGVVVCHDQAIRYLENALLGEDPMFGPVQQIPNTTPYGYSRAELATASARLAERAAQGG